MSGELELDSSGNLVLTVVLERDNLYTNVENRNYSIPIINGYARNWETSRDLAFTLFENSIFGYHKSGLSKYTIHCRFATTLKHYNHLSSLRFGCAFLKFQLVNDWIEASGLKGVRHKTKKKYNIRIDYNQPEPITILRNKDFHLYIWFMANTHEGRRDFKLDEYPQINIEFKENKSFDQFWEIYQSIRNFFSFCISLPVTSQQIEFRQFTDRELRKQAQTRQSTMSLLMSDSKTYTKRESLQSDLMLIDYERIEGKETQFLNRWFSLTREIEPVFKLYFDTLYNPDLYTENALLNYVSALETFHRIRNPSFDGKDEAHSKKLESILSKLKMKNDREWISAKLKKRRESKLYDRLTDITKRTPMISQKLLGDPAAFCLSLSKTRNYFTHFDPSIKKNGVPEGKDLSQLLNKSKVLLQTQILIDLGFDENETYKLLRKTISNWHVWNS
jgi:hypothetical protein